MRKTQNHSKNTKPQEISTPDKPKSLVGSLSNSEQHLSCELSPRSEVPISKVPKLETQNDIHQIGERNAIYAATILDVVVCARGKR